MLLFYGAITMTIATCCILYARRQNTWKQSRLKNVRTLICIGSGGHTAEMMRILKKMNREKYSPRMYTMASDDTTSEVKVLNYERESDSYSLSKIYRSRKVGQSFAGSIFTTLFALWTSVPVVVRFRPEVIICNGPGTCIPVCAVAALMRFFGLMRCKIVFVESICRVKSLSLSGWILLKIADVFAVQWEELAKTHLNVIHLGKLS